ncbi:FecR family protein [Dongia sedimenti]|uniref:FecR family protein n=1 Tax=Dongia sedimenti TaxID=3064282 RepID=A0ABU0YKI0_9PROT|nr:FecR family protein [Rhodospirillaceae bacterium R-7]
MMGHHSLGTARRLVVAAILCVSLILAASQAFAAAFVAQAVKTRGDIRITRDGGDISCSMGTAVQLGDLIRTGADARLRLRFVDGSILTLGENTKLSVDLFAVDATNKSRTVVLTVLEGIVNASAAKSGESKFDYQIKTGAGYSAVRGTKWIVSFRQALMTVYVLNGTVEMGGNAGGPPALINAGQWGSIDAAGILSPVQPTTPELLKPVLDATSDTAMNSVPPSTTPAQPPIPLPQITPTPTQPKPPTRANKGNQGGNNNNSGGKGGYGGSGMGTN